MRRRRGVVLLLVVLHGLEECATAFAPLGVSSWRGSSSSRSLDGSAWRAGRGASLRPALGRGRVESVDGVGRRRSRSVLKRLKRSAVGAGIGACAIRASGGGGWQYAWCGVPALVPWTPVFDTARLIVLFMRAARVDILEQRFLLEANAFTDGLLSESEAIQASGAGAFPRLAAALESEAKVGRPLKILCMDGGGARGGERVIVSHLSLQAPVISLESARVSTPSEREVLLEICSRVGQESSS